MFRKTLIVTFFACTSAANAADLTGVDCTPPKLILTFASAVSDWAASGASNYATQGLTSVKFKKDSNSALTVDLTPGNCEFNSAKTECTMYVARTDYEDTYAWNVWPVAVEATADGDTATVACN